MRAPCMVHVRTSPVGSSRHAATHQREGPASACMQCICVVVPDPRAACLLGCKRARAGEQMAGRLCVGPGTRALAASESDKWPWRRWTSLSGSIDRPVHANAPRTGRRSRQQAAPCAGLWQPQVAGCIGHVAPACRRGPSLPGCWLCLPLPCRRARLADRRPLHPSTRSTPSIGRRLDRRMQGRIRARPAGIRAA